MENSVANHNEEIKKSADLKKVDKNYFWKGLALILFAIIVLTQLFDISIAPKISFLNSSLDNKNIILSPGENSYSSIDVASITQEVLPADGVVLPIVWGDLGKRMIEDGVIDEEKFMIEEDATRINLYFKKVKHTPNKYPRAYGQIKKKPLED